MDFIDRENEIEALDELYQREGAQFFILYGRRRTGKTALLIHWGRNKPHLYWVASRTSAANLLSRFSQALWNFANPDNLAGEDFSYGTWERAFRQAGDLARDARLIVTLDEFPYAVEANGGVPSFLQNVWDHHLKQTNIFLVLSGSHIGMVEREMVSYRAPLYGRATGIMLLKPLPFPAVRQFFPRWSPLQQVTAYAILGGIPGYLEKFDDRYPVARNVRERILSTTSLFFQIEPFFLVGEALREPRNYLAILQAIARGHRQLSAIARAAGLERSNTGSYLDTLRRLHLVERRVPATERHPERSRKGIYVLQDNYLRFYFRFIAPHQDWLERGQKDRLWHYIEEQLPSFVGSTAFEELCRQCVWAMGNQGQLPFYPDRVGAYWDRKTQVDVVAISWEAQAILLGEAKWTRETVGVPVLEGLKKKTAHVIPGPDWAVHHVLFSRSGFTPSLQQRAADEGVWLVPLEQIVAA